jgi:hypothetical protein
MKVIVTQKQLELIRENAPKTFNCEMCNHSWKIEMDDKHPYLCHKCSYDSSKKKYNNTDTIKESIDMNGYDLDKIKKSFKIMSQLSETFGEGIPLEFKLNDYSIKVFPEFNFHKKMILYVDVYSEDGTYYPPNGNWHNIELEILNIFEMAGIYNHQKMSPVYNIKFNEKSNKLKESKKLDIILTESQFQRLNELTGNFKSRIQKLCHHQKENKPFCRLYELEKVLNEDDKFDLEVAIETLDTYFRYKNVGMFPKIVEMALQDEGRTVSYLKLISDFIKDKEFDDSETKRILNKQRFSREIPKNFDEILKQARSSEHKKYEESFIGDYFGKTSTFLRLNYNCGDNAKETLFQILTRVKSKEQTLDIVFDNIIKCVQKSLTQGSYYLKADLITKKDLKYEGETIIPSGTHFEVKKMDPFIDSYLSEFFSIFKETEKIAFKGEYVELYNDLIQMVYEWLINNPDAEQYLNKVKSKIGGIIYENNTIVPIEYIDLYWSNKGQRSCDEKRLSIRFKIKDGIDTIKTYRYKNDEELIPIEKKVPYNQKEKVICR